MKPMILMGDEAIAQAALDAGIRGAFSYPGTPATEILEYVQTAVKKGAPVFARWSTNEKVAYEEALGASYAGGRSMVSMKHVGLNVAADPFMNSAITGANGGLLVVVADDPAMHSSQNEQDSRYFASFGFVPCLEPSNQQEAYDMAFDGLDLSEELGLPVMIRLVTRLAHSRSAVIPRSPRTAGPRPMVNDPRRFTLLPVNARRSWAELKRRWPSVEARVAELPWNRLFLGEGRIGVVAAGVGFNYFMEACAGQAEAWSWLKVGGYPLPQSALRDLFDHCREVLVIEEGYPFIEAALRGVLDRPPKPVHGKLDGLLPATGELTPENVRKALGISPLEVETRPLAGLAPRPPALCKGCPHADTYAIINEVMQDQPQGRVFSDIGCYTLGALPPYEAIHTCVDMGASVSMAFGAAVTADVFPSLAVIGDSTFAHSGITPLLDAVRSDANMVLVILDNDTTAMTGRQPSALTGKALFDLLVGAGMSPEHVRVLHAHPKEHSANVAVFREEMAWKGLSIIVATRPCIQIR
jgi:indolepyruvate ferredoxin oxidoreductase, alpha subunit